MWYLCRRIGTRGGAIGRKRSETIDLRTRPERAALVGRYSHGRERARALESMQELEALAVAAGAEVVGEFLQERAQPDAAYFVGRGKAEELRHRAEAGEFDLLVFDHELTPGQMRNLENEIGLKVLDRTQLILDIFARRARTREGKLQVELAQLSYLLPRLSGKGTMLSRLGGGIGTRGPGETKLEMDRRRIRRRISLLRRELEKVGLLRGLQRSKRQGVPLPVVALVGYTNAGKSTLFNALTNAHTVSSDKLFSTLDPLLRRLCLPNGIEILLSDTVGFVRKLPHDIVAAFRATLEEVREADLLLHIVDMSVKDWREQAAAVEDVLAQLGVSSKPLIVVFNKADLLLDRGGAAGDTVLPRGAIIISALQGEGLGALLERVMHELGSFSVQVELKIPYGQAAIVSRLHEEGRVYSELFEEDGVRIGAELPRSTVYSLQRYVLGYR